MDNYLTVSPSNMEAPTPPELKSLFGLNENTLRDLHDLLITQVRTTLQMKWLCQQTMTSDQIRRYLSEHGGSFEEIKNRYQVLYLDDWISTPMEDRQYRLAIRCYIVFLAALKPSEPEEKKCDIDQENETLSSLGKSLPSNRKEDRLEIYERILKPLSKEVLSDPIFNFSIKELSSLKGLSRKEFVFEFFSFQTADKLKDYILILLMPCIRTLDAVRQINKFICSWTHNFPDLEANKSRIKQEIEQMDPSEMLSLAVEMHRVLSNSKPHSSDVDPIIPLPISTGHNPHEFDSKLSAEIFKDLFFPLLKSDWRARAILRQLTQGSVITWDLQNPKEALQLFAEKPANNEVIKTHLISCLRILTHDGCKRERPESPQPIQATPPSKKRKIIDLNDRKEVGRILVFQGYMFSKMRVALEKLGCSKRAFRDIYWTGFFPWPPHYKLKVRTHAYEKQCLERIEKGMKFFGIEHERDPSEVFKALREKGII